MINCSRQVFQKRCSSRDSIEMSNEAKVWTFGKIAWNVLELKGVVLLESILGQRLPGVFVASNRSVVGKIQLFNPDTSSYIMVVVMDGRVAFSFLQYICQIALFEKNWPNGRSQLGCCQWPMDLLAIISTSLLSNMSVTYVKSLNGFAKCPNFIC